ncbi:MAG: hypothetical protein WBS22_09150 [Methylocystis sp.]
MRHGANEKHPPKIVFAMLYGFGLAGSLLAGFSMAAADTPSRIHLWAFAFALSFALYVMTNAEFPRLGVVPVNAFDHFLTEVSHGGLCENAMKGEDKAARRSLSQSKLKDALYAPCRSLSYMTYLIKWLRFLFLTWPRIVASRDVQRRRRASGWTPLPAIGLDRSVTITETEAQS